ncbi:nuclear transport factor 2 family protein [Fibrisoma montanum]|uniref:Nuclear transport factor 2 family protein n=1 Tax=Fibrisoma montanum TaxID=2305895 RepID=A0A418M8L5_9BACT|nr:nuclear transport factor 2 family protein [Fibrisoma montanum]RIV22436.1 nuclear transport factor 2 family protein [Fibrisoma montanum]
MKTQQTIYPVAVVTIALSLTLSSQSQAQTVSATALSATKPTTIHQAKPNNMENQAAQTVKTFLTAVQKGDQATLGALIHPNIRWNQPGSNRFSGAKQSNMEVFQMVGGMYEASANTLQLTDIKQLTINGNKVACLIHWKAVQPGGGVLDVDNIDVYTVEDGKIVEAMIYSENVAQEDEFWGK